MRKTWFFVFLGLVLVGATAWSQKRAERPTGERKALGTEAEDPSETLLPDEEIQEIDWEAAEAYRKLDGASVPASLEQTYSESPVPVLLPDEKEALESLQPTVGENWYAALFHLDGREVTIEGDRVARMAPDFELPKAGQEQADEGFLVTQTDAVLTVSFTAFNAAYSIDVECKHVDERGTCTDKSFALELANDLAVLGGRP